MNSCIIVNRSERKFRICTSDIKTLCLLLGAKDDWDFRISYLVKNPDGTDILTPMVNFGEVRRAQLAKSTLFTSSLVPLGSFQIF